MDNYTRENAAKCAKKRAAKREMSDEPADGEWQEGESLDDAVCALEAML
jgi:hypothetical protein